MTAFEQIGETKNKKSSHRELRVRTHVAQRHGRSGTVSSAAETGQFNSERTLENLVFFHSKREKRKEKQRRNQETVCAEEQPNQLTTFPPRMQRFHNIVRSAAPARPPIGGIATW